MGLLWNSKAEIRFCLDKLEEIKTYKSSGRDERLEELLAAARKLKGGKMLAPQLQKLVMADNVDRAIKLMNAFGESSPIAQAAPTLIFPIIAVGVVVVMSILPRFGGQYELAMRALNECPQATDALGSNIAHSPLGISCGSTETRGGGFGHAQWSMTVSGNNGRGSFQYAAEQHGGNWRLVGAQLEVGGETISVVPCGDLKPQGKALTSAYEDEGVVSVSNGSSPVKKEDKCTVAVSPNPSFGQSPHNCHVKIRCGTTTVYGWGKTGFTHCESENGRPTKANDTSATDGDPILELDLTTKTVSVLDDKSIGGFSFTIKLNN